MGKARSQYTDVTAAETELLEIVLAAARKAATLRRPVHITIDPWIPCDGANVHVEYDYTGTKHEISGVIGRSRKYRTVRTRGRRS